MLGDFTPSESCCCSSTVPTRFSPPSGDPTIIGNTKPPSVSFSLPLRLLTLTLQQRPQNSTLTSSLILSLSHNLVLPCQLKSPASQKGHHCAAPQRYTRAIDAECIRKTSHTAEENAAQRRAALGQCNSQPCSRDRGGGKRRRTNARSCRPDTPPHV